MDTDSDLIGLRDHSWPSNQICDREADKNSACLLLREISRLEKNIIFIPFNIDELNGVLYYADIAVLFTVKTILKLRHKNVTIHTE